MNQGEDGQYIGLYFDYGLCMISQNNKWKKY